MATPIKMAIFVMKKPDESMTGNFFHIFRNHLLYIIAVTSLGVTGSAAAQTEVAWHNESADTTKITRILVDEASDARPGSISRIGRRFIDIPYEANTLESDGPERLRVNLDGMDCTTFVETVTALALTAREHRQSWQDFLYNLEGVRYRNGRADGYPSRLHYMSAWILDNVSRGNLREVTGDMPGVRHRIKTLDYMTRHREQYPALADSANFAGMKRVESGFSNFRYPYLKGNSLKNKDLLSMVRDGDIIVFTSAAEGLDATHMGIAVVDDDTVRLLHASSKAGKVVIDELSLADYLRRNRTDGIRIVRLAAQ